MSKRALIATSGGLSWAAAALFVAGFGAGCGNNNPQPPTTSSGTFTGSGTTGGSAGSSDTGGGGAGGTASTGGTGGTAGAAGGTGGTGGAVNCTGPDGCYSCPPKADKEFLNACTTAQCAPFDNAARLPLYNNGSLPPLP